MRGKMCRLEVRNEKKDVWAGSKEVIETILQTGGERGRS